MRPIEKEMADEADRISHILRDFPLRLEANIQMWPNNEAKSAPRLLFTHRMERCVRSASFACL